VQWDGQKWH